MIFSIITLANSSIVVTWMNKRRRYSPQKNFALFLLELSTQTTDQKFSTASAASGGGTMIVRRENGTIKLISWPCSLKLIFKIEVASIIRSLQCHQAQCSVNLI